MELCSQSIITNQSQAEPSQKLKFREQNQRKQPQPLTVGTEPTRADEETEIFYDDLIEKWKQNRKHYRPPYSIFE